MTKYTLFAHAASKRAPLSLRRAVSVTLALALLCSGLAALQMPQLQELAAKRYGDNAVTTIRSWEDLIGAYNNSETLEKLRSANDFFNDNILWLSDEKAWNQTDYWATPLETMGKAVGDCEDFTIAKYATLLLMGLPPESLRLVYVKAKRNGLTQAHMVLAWYESPLATPLILDNLDLAIKSATERGDLFPVFSFNANQLWMATQTQATDADPQARLSRWSQVLLRMRQEGFNLGS